MTSPFADSVLEQLMAAAARERRRRRVRVGAALTAALSAVGGSLALLWPGAAVADVEVTRTGGYVVVRVTDSSATPDELVDALGEEGIVASADAAPVGPSDVGEFIRVQIAGGLDTVELLGGENGHTAFRVPEGFSGELTITLGRAAGEGEPYSSFVDPFADREPLHCAGVFGQPLDRAARALEDVDPDLDAGVVLVVDGVEGDQVPLADALGAHPTWVVSGGKAVSSDRVVLEIEQGPTREEPGC